MKFLIVSHVPHKYVNGQYYGYAPYVREMNIWLKYVDKLIVIAPLSSEPLTAVDQNYDHSDICFKAVPSFNLLGLTSILNALISMPKITFRMFFAMRRADHIHLRCPGNMGLIGCLVQILFPLKKKTAKYAGNWDPDSRQPWSYKLQRRILNNTFLTRNIKVLVYGEWPDSGKNIKPFFTATYSENEVKPLHQETVNILKFVFAGGLVSGKNPKYAVNLVKILHEQGKQVRLDLYGDGPLYQPISEFITANRLENQIKLHGNQSKEILKEAFIQAQFVILPSDSEGWPKAVAEGMFWGCVPLATSVSCVPMMLGHGKRGLLLSMDLIKDGQSVTALLDNPDNFIGKGVDAAAWSRQFTTEVFETEIKKLLQ
ncbi:glycosyltransferase [Flavobacterium pallidum]|uniref:Glycosyl transferase n=1 Tax=Flavobacterium pallidum TaxID=2172098 RepID=A0A2S1SH23_9FLAO|nr:glycosyltransferase [Flavobacterium pallidum]AWI25681.1 glycosyl transferase [Flavobacterium pallidum]